ncbi:hypothetical protein MNKW57_20540 [Biformimicrobium ophioploci]|uniref:Uncharacterized protein n=1 Tax=Biformimicrobium ophioploci TaxID=3036711 RepID=A0ABQ6M063_9GAMM|nr:hypothetical protein MNKW57_20540 [Microbulbifer sp. NKW57]
MVSIIDATGLCTQSNDPVIVAAEGVRSVYLAQNQAQCPGSVSRLNDVRKNTFSTSA